MIITWLDSAFLAVLESVREKNQVDLEEKGENIGLNVIRNRTKKRMRAL